MSATTVERRVYALSALIFAACITLMTQLSWGNVRWWALPVMTLVALVSESCNIKLQIGRHHWYVAFTESSISAALVFALGSWLVPAIALGVLLSVVRSGKSHLKVVFNVAQFGLSVAVGVWAGTAAGGGVLGAAIGIGAFWLVNYLAVALVIWVSSEGAALSDIFDVSGAINLINAAANASLGLLAAWLTLHAPLGLLALVVPCALIWVSYDQQTRQALEARLFSELADGQERVSGRSSDASARVVLTAAARLFGGDAEMLLMTADGPVRYLGDDRSVTRERVEQDAFGASWVQRALGTRTVTTGIEADGRPYCATVLGDAATPMAVLVVRRPERAQAFDRREQNMAAVLIRQASSWLSVAELTESRDEAREMAEAATEAARALGDMGANTWPAMVSLRESASRLSRLATMPEGPDPVGDIVGELHAAERAVASLLGAIALAADPELARALDTDEMALPTADTRVPDDDVWTTTGVLESQAVDSSP
jgi:hypothetical protein